MQEQRRSSSGVEGSHQLLRDNSALAYTSHDDSPATASALHHQLYGAGEWGGHTVFETVRKSKQRFGFYADQLSWSGCAHQSSKAKTIDRSRRPLEWET